MQFSTQFWARFSLVLVVAVGLGACATIKTGTDYDPETDFSAYKTVSWEIDSVVVAPGSEPLSAMGVRRIREAIESQLVQRGINLVDSGAAADLHVGAVVGARQRIKRESYPVHSGHYHDRWGWCGAWCYETQDVERTYTEGTLSVDLFDTDSNKPIWHGWAQKTITSSDREHPKQSIEAAVSEMFKDFPR